MVLCDVFCIIEPFSSIIAPHSCSTACFGKLSDSGDIRFKWKRRFFCTSLVFIYLFSVSQMNTNQFLSVWSILQALFDGSWHQLKVLVKPSRVTCFLDDQQIQDEALEAAVPIYINGKTQISKRFGSDATLPVSVASCCVTEHCSTKVHCSILVWLLTGCSRVLLLFEETPNITK